MSELNVGKVTLGNGLVLPSVAEGAKPAAPEIGLTIYNSTSGLAEMWNGTEWTNLSQPPVTTQFKVSLWGAGGGGGAPGGWAYGANGAGGGFVYAELEGLPPGGTLILQVGEGGPVNGQRVSYGGGGQASRNGSDARYGSNGGGATALLLSPGGHSNVIMIAAGGGGGGSSRAGAGNIGGAGGGSTGIDGASPYDGKSAYRGRGGTQAGGGVQASSDCTNTDFPAGPLLGGSPRCNSYGGAGGGGYYGGSAGGYSEQHTMAGGGGGSSYSNINYAKSVVNNPGSGQTSGGAQAGGYPGGSIGGGGGVSTVGGHGYARIENVVTGQVTTYTFTGSDVQITVP